MGYVEVFQMNNEGAGWVNLNDLPIGEIMAIEIEMATQASTAQLLCVVCLIPIPSGMGHSYCTNHNPRKAN